MGKKRKCSEVDTPSTVPKKPVERYPPVWELPSTSIDSTQDESIDLDRVQAIRSKFGLLHDALRDVLSEPGSDTEFLMAVGSEDKFTFVQALKSLYRSGDMKWLASDEKSSKKEDALSQSSSQYSTSLSPGNLQTKKWPPPLPAIKNNAIGTQVFTHASFLGGDGSGLGDEQRHYQRLEFLGDAALNFVTTNILYHRFPTSREGQLSVIRQEFISNKNLYTYSMAYNFHNRVRLGKDAIQQDTRWRVKYSADIFEAYIGGLLADRPGLEGLHVVDKFLRELFEPQLLQQLGVARDKLPPINKQARHELWGLIGGSPAAKLRYSWTGGEGGSEKGFWFTVYFTGYNRYTDLALGRGYGQSKQDAQLRAAMDALENNTVLLEDIKKTKDEYLTAKKKASSTSAPHLALPAPPTPPTLPPLPPPTSLALPPPSNPSSQDFGPQERTRPSSFSSSTLSNPRHKKERKEADTSWLWSPSSNDFSPK